MMLSPTFFNRPTRIVARELLGKRLVRRTNGRTISGLITETEAYDGPRDRASHASRGRTPRNSPMFGPAGTIYVYLIYGMHWCLNLVTSAAGYPAAVLIRGVVVAGVPPRQTNGPGKVCRTLEVDGRCNARPLGTATGLWVEDDGIAVPPRRVRRTPRIGVDYAGAYRRKPWRFVWTTAAHDHDRAR